MSRKKDLKNQNEGEILKQKGRFLADFTRRQKGDKKMALLTRKLAKKKGLFVYEIK